MDIYTTTYHFSNSKLEDYKLGCSDGVNEKCYSGISRNRPLLVDIAGNERERTRLGGWAGSDGGSSVSLVSTADDSQRGFC